MSNRSYLYAINFDATKSAPIHGGIIYGLSEYDYYMPISYMLLTSVNPKISKSIIWKEEGLIAIQGDFKAGKKKLYEFLDKLLQLDLFDKDKLTQEVLNTKEFLDKRNLEYIILECGEIYEMGEDEFEDQNKEVYDEEILNVEHQVDLHLNDFKKLKKTISLAESEINQLEQKGFSNDSEEIKNLEKKIASSEHEMWRLLGVTYWSDVLYHSFDNE